MNSINLIGRTTADPELRSTPGGARVCSFLLAVNLPPGEDQSTMFVKVVASEAEAEAIAEHVGKGRQVAVSGASATRRGRTPTAPAASST